ncbi:TPA: glycosyltransferase [Bacillus luti]
MEDVRYMRQNKIKVLHLLQSGHFSGAENVACKIIEIFKDDEVFEMAYCSKNGQIGKIMEQKNILYYPMSHLCLSELKRVVNLFQPDIIHAHDATASVVSTMLIKNYPVLSHLHSNPPWIKKVGRNSIMYFISSLRIKNILTVSNSIMDEYIFGTLMLNKTKVITNPIDTNAIRIKARDAKCSKKSYDVVYIGRLARPKNPFKFIELIKQLKGIIPNISAVMIGDGDLRQGCEDLINKLSLHNNITLTGFMENPYGILEKSKILCVTSKWEGYGLVAVEAMALGRPVVCPPVGGLPGLVKDSCGKVCDSDNVFIKEMEQLLLDKEYWRNKSEGATIQAELLDNIPDYKESINNIYSQMLGVKSIYDC